MTLDIFQNEVIYWTWVQKYYLEIFLEVFWVVGPLSGNNTLVAALFIFIRLDSLVSTPVFPILIFQRGFIADQFKNYPIRYHRDQRPGPPVYPHAGAAGERAVNH